jgi:hypothetical protein
LAEVQERLSQPSLTPEARADIEAYRSQIMTAGAGKTGERQASIAKHEADLRAELDRERRVQAQLVEKLRSLGETPPRY